MIKTFKRWQQDADLIEMTDEMIEDNIEINYTLFKMVGLTEIKIELAVDEGELGVKLEMQKAKEVITLI
jgi:hypothetical protein